MTWFPKDEVPGPDGDAPSAARSRPSTTGRWHRVWGRQRGRSRTLTVTDRTSKGTRNVENTKRNEEASRRKIFGSAGRSCHCGPRTQTQNTETGIQREHRSLRGKEFKSCLARATLKTCQPSFTFACDKTFTSHSCCLYTAVRGDSSGKIKLA